MKINTERTKKGFTHRLHQLISDPGNESRVNVVTLSPQTDEYGKHYLESGESYVLEDFTAPYPGTIELSGPGEAMLDRADVVYGSTFYIKQFLKNSFRFDIHKKEWIRKKSML